MIMQEKKLTLTLMSIIQLLLSSKRVLAYWNKDEQSELKPRKVFIPRSFQLA